MASLFRPTYTTIDRRTGRRAKRKAKKWYGQYTDADGTLRRVPLSANKTAAQQMLTELVRRAEMGKVGIRDPFVDHRARPLTDHLVDWEACLRAGGTGDKTVRQAVACARRVINACGFSLIADMSASRVQTYLASLRDCGRSVAIFDPTKEWYTRAELAALLGVTGPAVPSLLRRHGLIGIGNGKARRYPRTTAEALQSMRGRGRGIRTVNQHLAAVKQFARWLVRDRRSADNPFAHLAGGNVQLDRRHSRRALTDLEMRAVIVATQQSRHTLRGLNGRDRAMLYALAIATGFRANELSCLRPEVFDLEASIPTVTLAAGFAKNGRTAVQPLPPDLIEALRGYLDGRPAGMPVWPGSWAVRAAEMFNADLVAANVPYFIDGPDGRLYADFHSLRHTYIARLDRSGATLKEAMQLARHSDPKLTMAVYGRARLHDLGAAVGRLSTLLTDPIVDGQRVKARRRPVVGRPGPNRQCS
jgi:integrase